MFVLAKLGPHVWAVTLLPGHFFIHKRTGKGRRETDTDRHPQIIASKLPSIPRHSMWCQGLNMYCVCVARDKVGNLHSELINVVQDVAFCSCF